MVEDKLTHDERLRLESVAQAIANNMGKRMTIEMILTEAGRIERFVRGEDNG